MNMNRIWLLIIVTLFLSATQVMAQAPEVTHIYPGAGINEQSITARIYGDDFEVSAISSVKLVKTGYPDISGTSINVVSQVYLTCSFDLTGGSTGLYDLVVTNTSGEDTLPRCFTVYARSDPPYPWVKTTVGSGDDDMFGVAVGDGDGDGEIEVYAANKDNHMYQFKWNGSSWDRTDMGFGGDAMNGVAVGDGNGDGEIEVYGANWDSHMYQFKWNGSSWDRTDMGFGTDYMTAVAVGDGDGDGEIEVYGANYDNSVYQFKWNGSSWDKTVVGPGTYAVAIGDGNGDEEMEVYSSHWDGNVYQHKWNGSSWNTTPVSPGMGIGGKYGVAVGDGNGDGEMEVYGAHYTHNIFQFKWNGSNWLIEDLPSGQHYMTDVCVGDGNGDGGVKVYGANYDRRMIYQFEWNGSDWDKTDMGSLGGGNIFTGMFGVAVGDGNEDGEMEVYGASIENKIFQFKPAFAPDITLSRTSYYFGTVLLGDSLDWEDLVIKNMGVDTLFVDSIIPDTTAFIVIDPSFPNTILPDDSILVTVRFKPLGVGLIINSPLGIYSNDPDETILYIILAGNCDTLPDIVLSDTTHDFGEVAIGDSLDWQGLVIKNKGWETLVIDSLISDTAAFIIVDPLFPDSIRSVNYVDSIVVTIRFKPSINDTINGTVRVYSSDRNQPVVDVSLTGIGLSEDVIPPTPFSLISPSDSAILANTRPTFIWEASSDTLSGLKEYEVYIDDILRHTVTDTTWLADYDLPEGWHKWYVVAYDSAGNARQSTETWPVLIDTTSPSVVVLILPFDEAYLNNSTVNFVWNSSIDNLSGIDYYVLQYSSDNTFSSGVVETTLVDTTFTTILTDTTYYWKVRAIDKATNQSDWSSVWSFEIDTQIPNAPTLISPVGGIYFNNHEVVFEWSAVQMLGLGPKGSRSPIKYVLQIDTSISFSNPVVVDTGANTYDTLTLDEDRYYWRVKAYDLSGNESPFSASDSFGVDLTAPSAVTLISPSDGAYLNESTIDFVWNKANDALSGIDYYVLQYTVNSSFSSGVVETTLVDTTFTTALSDTTYYWRVKARDRATNQSNWSSVWSFEIDTQAPSTPMLISPVGGVYLNNSVIGFEWSGVQMFGFGFGRDRSPIKYVLQVDTSISFSMPVAVDTVTNTYDTLVLSEDNYFWRVRAYDFAGNESPFSAPDSFGVDLTAPSAPVLISPGNGTLLNTNNPTFIWHKSIDNLSGIDHYLLQYDTDGSFSNPITTSISDTIYTSYLPDSLYYWRVKAVDRATNQGNWSSVWSFEIDTQTPNAPILISPIDGIYLSDILVTFEWTEVTNLPFSIGRIQKVNNNNRSEWILDSQVMYILQIDTLLGFTSPLITDTLNTTSTTLSLYENSPFYWRVKAYDLAGNQGPYANPESFGVDITAPLIESTTVWSDTSFVGPFEIRTKVTDDLSGVDSVILYYKRNEDPEWLSVVMNPSGSPDWYLDSIPSVSNPDDTVRYYVEALDASQPGNGATDPEGAPTNYYWFIANYDPGIMESEDQPAFFTFGLKSNPAKGKAVFNLALPQAALIMLRIYDVSGRLIDTPITGKRSAGTYEITWTPKTNAGVYFYALKSSWGNETGKILFVR